MKKIILFSFILFSIFAVKAQEGFPDLSFGTNGIVELPQVRFAFDNSGRLTNATIANGAIITLTRYNANGTLDASFGTGGVVTKDFGIGPFGSAFFGAVSQFTFIVQKDGKIVVGLISLGPNTALYLVRFNSDGMLDVSFGAGGIVSQGRTQGRAPTISFLGAESDGKIVVAENNFSPGGPFASGSIFNVNGTVAGNLAVTPPVINGFFSPLISGGSFSGPFIDQADHIIIGQTYSVNRGSAIFDNYFVLNRLYPAGSVDVAFGNNGAIQFNYSRGNVRLLDDYPLIPVAAQYDGKIIMRTAVLNNYVRLNSNGSPDPTFGNGGVLRPPFTVTKIFVQTDNKLIFGGNYNEEGANANFIIARYNADGSFDPGFGYGGMMVTPLGAGAGTKTIRDMVEVGNRLYVYGDGIVAAYHLSSLLLNTTANRKGPIAKESGQQLRVVTLSNPSTTHFTLQLKSKSTEPAQVRVIDALSRTVEWKRNVASNSMIKIGDNYRNGLYYAEITQGGEKVTVRLVKASQ